jgi:hypothetical protein
MNERLALHKSQFFSELNCLRSELQAMENRKYEKPALSGIKQGGNMKRIFNLSLLFSATVLLASLASATAQEQRRIVLRDSQFKESFLQKVTVSGGIRAGFAPKFNGPRRYS